MALIMKANGFKFNYYFFLIFGYLKYSIENYASRDDSTAVFC